jgi:hypothetical protein
MGSETCLCSPFWAGEPLPSRLVVIVQGSGGGSVGAEFTLVEG